LKEKLQLEQETHKFDVEKNRGKEEKLNKIFKEKHSHVSLSLLKLLLLPFSAATSSFYFHYIFLLFIIFRRFR
jgi:hypothetical protein